MAKKTPELKEWIDASGKKRYSIDGVEFDYTNVNMMQKYLYYKNRAPILERRKTQYANYYKDYKDKYYLKNKVDINAKHAQKYNSSDKTKKKSMTEYYLKNKPIINERQRKYHLTKYSSDPQFKIKSDMRGRINKSVQIGCKLPKEIGLSTEKFKEYLEKLFEPGMSWDNRKEWHIDHINPVKNFDLTDTIQRTLCYHYTNLKPMWAKDNREKSGGTQ